MADAINRTHVLCPDCGRRKGMTRSGLVFCFECRNKKMAAVVRCPQHGEADRRIAAARKQARRMHL